MKIEDFVHIFYSNYSSNTDWEQLEEILWMHDNHLFTLKKIKLASHEQFCDLIDLFSQNRYKYVEESGDGIAHQALKKIASDFLISQFGIKAEDILFEQSFCGFEADVIDKTLHFPIECGDTNPFKFEKYLLNENVKKLIIIPYPHDKEIFAFIFTPTSKLKEYLLHKRSYLRQTIRDKINKSRK